MPAHLKNLAVAMGLEKASSYFNLKDNDKECSKYCTTALIPHANKVMIKILQARLQITKNFQMYKLHLEKSEELEIKLPASTGS